ncbi:hypothetical protein C8R46DRAFT_1289848 [Mycena filopes]|nr:hypothetical protein C8R46DRAFT_1289848 [Mycena filopes]
MGRRYACLKGLGRWTLLPVRGLARSRGLKFPADAFGFSLLPHVESPLLTPQRYACYAFDERHRTQASLSRTNDSIQHTVFFPYRPSQLHPSTPFHTGPSLSTAHLPPSISSAIYCTLPYLPPLLYPSSPSAQTVSLSCIGRRRLVPSAPQDIVLHLPNASITASYRYPRTEYALSCASCPPIDPDRLIVPPDSARLSFLGRMCRPRSPDAPHCNGNGALSLPAAASDSVALSSAGKHHRAASRPGKYLPAFHARQFRPPTSSFPVSSPLIPRHPPPTPRPLSFNPFPSQYLQRVAHLRKPHPTYISFALLPHPHYPFLPLLCPSLPTSPPLPFVAIRPRSLFVAYRPLVSPYSRPPRYRLGSPRCVDYPLVRVAVDRMYRPPPCPRADWLGSLTIAPVVVRASPTFDIGSDSANRLHNRGYDPDEQSRRRRIPNFKAD